MYGNFSESSLEAAAALFDFTRCVRADGSAYGTRGKCRKGREAGPKESEKSLEKVYDNAKTFGGRNYGGSAP